MCVKKRQLSNHQGSCRNCIHSQKSIETISFLPRERRQTGRTSLNLICALSPRSCVIAVGSIVLLHLETRVFLFVVVVGAQQVVSEHPRFFVGFSGDSEGIGC